MYALACARTQEFPRGLSDAQELGNVTPVEGCNQLFAETPGTYSRERFVCTMQEQTILLVFNMDSTWYLI